MGKQTKPVTIPVDAFLRHNQPAQAPATALMRFDVPLSMNSFELVAKYLGIRFEDFQCRSHQSKGHEFHEVWVDLTKKWNCGIAIAYGQQSRYYAKIFNPLRSISGSIFFSETPQFFQGRH